MIRVLLGLLGAAVAAAGANVVLIVSDDQGYGDISCYSTRPTFPPPTATASPPAAPA